MDDLLSNAPDSWHHLQSTPLDEIKKRAKAVELMNSRDVAHLEVPDAERYAWNDGGGQSTVWYFKGDKAMLLTFDHEADLNLYADDDAYQDQLGNYRGVPDELLELVTNQSENYESLNIESDSGETVLYAGGIFWHDGNQWTPAAGLVAYCEERSVDLWSGAGFNYCLSPYLLGRDFTADELVAEKVELGYSENEVRSSVEDALKAAGMSLTSLAPTLVNTQWRGTRLADSDGDP